MRRRSLGCRRPSSSISMRPSSTTPSIRRNGRSPVPSSTTRLGTLGCWRLPRRLYRVPSPSCRRRAVRGTGSSSSRTDLVRAVRRPAPPVLPEPPRSVIWRPWACLGVLIQTTCCSAAIVLSGADPKRSRAVPGSPSDIASWRSQAMIFTTSSIAPSTRGGVLNLRRCSVRGGSCCRTPCTGLGSARSSAAAARPAWMPRPAPQPTLRASTRCSIPRQRHRATALGAARAGQRDVHPDQSVIAAGGGVIVHPGKGGVVLRRPVHP